VKNNQEGYRNNFITSERIFIELSSLALSRIQFLRSISDQFRLLSGCDAMEIRVSDKKLEYKWYTDFNTTTTFTDVEFYSDNEIGKIPVLDENTAIEKICRDIFRLRYDPLLKYEYKYTHRYIEDTSVNFNLVLNRSNKELDLSVTGYGSIFFLPFTVQDNPPGLLILYSKRKNFINKTDIPAYEDLMHIFSIALKFRRALYALNERIKELTCLYEINLIYQDKAEEPDVLLQEIAEHIPKAFQYPESASASIEIGKLEFHSKDTIQTTNSLISNVIYNNKKIGFIKVNYPDFIDNEEPMYFLPEEQNLLDIISQKVSQIYEKTIHKLDKQLIQEQLRHADRLATIGQLGSGIAHELNDPLANILGYAQLLMKTVTDPAQVTDLERIVRSSLHAREIVRKLLLFARQMPTIKSKVDLNKVITDTLDLLKSRVDQSKVILNMDLCSDLPLIEADPSQMTQVITNLCVNALQAMPQGGILDISTSISKEKVILGISDSGIGIKEEQRDKIFMPFYTTKPVGIGTGLGLSVVHGIVTSHNGTIAVHSKAGNGSQFVVSFPVKTERRQKVRK